MDLNGGISQYTGDDQDPWAHFDGTLSNVSVASDGTIWGLQTSGEIFCLVPTNTSPLSISEPHLLEENLARPDKAQYQFQVTNTGPGTTIRDLSLTLAYDEALFTANGIAVGPIPGVPGPLNYGESASLQFTLETKPSAVKGTYGFYSVRAVFTATRQNLSMSSATGGGWPSRSLPTSAKAVGEH